MKRFIEGSDRGLSTMLTAVAFMLKRMLMKRGFLDASANQIPVAVLARRYAGVHFDSVDEPMVHAVLTAVLGTGASCPECGARALHKVDGCQRCAKCYYIGSYG